MIQCMIDLNAAGDPIFSLHAQASGRRFATGGGDHCVKIWNLLAALDARQEENKSTHKLLATLNDHTGPVNVVRFCPSGLHLASGSDDTIACIFEYRPGSGGNVLGGEANVENWKTRFLLRGHSSHIVDLCWSPDGSLLATASLDSTVGIWDTSKGIRIHTITTHNSFVKGVAFDPVGTYLATFSEDKTVRIWKTEDWSRVATIRTPFQQMVTSTYACRMTWSPDGRYLLAGNSYQGATHAAVAVPREKWEKPEEYLLISGHGGVVVATAFNPLLFHVPPLGGGPPGQELGALFALGSQDKRLTVWASSSQRPLFCGSKLFKSQAVDVTWTPDGRALLASSTDGTVACLQFDDSELGVAATRQEMQEAMKALYGSASGRPTKRVFAESAEQLELEDRHQNESRREQEKGEQGPVGSGGGGAMIAAEKRSSAAIAALDARLGGGDGGGGRPMTGAVTQTGFGNAAPGSAHGRDAGLMPPPPPSMHQPRPKTLNPNIQQPPRGQHPGSAATAAAAAAAAAATTTTTTDSGLDPSSDTVAQHAKRAQREAPSSTGHSARYAARMTGLPVKPTLRSLLTPSQLANLGDGSAPAQQQQLELQATNINISTTDTYHSNSSNHYAPGAIALPPRAEVSLLSDGTAVWTDVLCNTHVVGMTGTDGFTAIATSDGHVIVYTPAGRRIAPPLKMGAGVAILTAVKTDRAASRLLVVSTTGSLKVLHIGDVMPAMLPSPMDSSGSPDALVPIKAVARCSLSALLEGNATVVDVLLSRHGVPVVSMSDGSVYVWQRDIEEWMRIADDSLTISSYGPVARSSSHASGEVERAQARALAPASAGMPRVLGNESAAATIRYHASRAHAEGSLAAAVALQSEKEFISWLVTYSRALTESNDEGRLKELCDCLLDVDSTEGGGGSELLGIPKMRLLDEFVLPEMAKNRSFGALLQRCRQASKDITRMMAS